MATWTLSDANKNPFCSFCFPGGKDVAWNFVHGLYEFAIYGGRVDNPFDMRVMRSYLTQFFDPGVIGGRGSKKLGPLRVPSSTNYRVCRFEIMYIFIYLTPSLFCQSLLEIRVSPFEVELLLRFNYILEHKCIFAFL